eukprot:TRINITY_DN7096_c0_g1_i1.p1 TRINITY_DN7096_c0_g1~~TRINITY_DN7096_c0_g1_i1.p1  ORF type:complete len:2281 (+),score=600.00 TRINITY_DN7096_c0_g1_i1:77-6919(+)
MGLSSGAPILGLGFVLICMTTTGQGVLWWLGAEAARKGVNDVSHSLRRSIIDSTVRRMYEFLELPFLPLDGILHDIASGGFSVERADAAQLHPAHPRDPRGCTRSLVHWCERYPALSGFYLGNEYGHFCSANCKKPGEDTTNWTVTTMPPLDQIRKGVPTWTIPCRFRADCAAQYGTRDPAALLPASVAARTAPAPYAAACEDASDPWRGLGECGTRQRRCRPYWAAGGGTVAGDSSCPSGPDPAEPPYHCYRPLQPPHATWAHAVNPTSQQLVTCRPNATDALPPCKDLCTEFNRTYYTTDRDFDASVYQKTRSNYEPRARGWYSPARGEQPQYGPADRWFTGMYICASSGLPCITAAVGIYRAVPAVGSVVVPFPEATDSRGLPAARGRVLSHVQTVEEMHALLIDFGNGTRLASARDVRLACVTVANCLNRTHMEMECTRQCGGDGTLPGPDAAPHQQAMVSKLVGVVEGDYESWSLRDMLDTIPVGKTGGMFVVEQGEEGLLVAMSASLPCPALQAGRQEGDLYDPMCFIKTTEDGPVRVSAYDAYAGPIVSGITNALFPDKSLQDLTEPLAASVSVGDTYWVDVVPLRRDNIRNVNWLLFVVLPKKDFFEDVEANRQETLYMSVATAGIVCICLVLSTQFMIARPIKLLIADFRIACDMRLEVILNQEIGCVPLREVWLLRQGFTTLCGHLAEYRSFLPSSLLEDMQAGADDASFSNVANPTETGLESTMAARNFTDIFSVTKEASQDVHLDGLDLPPRQPSAVSGGSSEKSSAGSGTPGKARHAFPEGRSPQKVLSGGLKKARFGLGLTPRPVVAVLVADLVEPDRKVALEDPERTSTRLCGIVANMVSSAEKFRANFEEVSGNRLGLTYNAPPFSCLEPPLQAVRTALAMSDALGQQVARGGFRSPSQNALIVSKSPTAVGKPVSPRAHAVSPAVHAINSPGMHSISPQKLAADPAAAARKCGVYMAIAHGGVMSGNVGSGTRRWRVAVGKPVTFAASLARLAADWEAPLLVQSSAELREQLVYRPLLCLRAPEIPSGSAEVLEVPVAAGVQDRHDGFVGHGVGRTSPSCWESARYREAWSALREGAAKDAAQLLEEHRAQWPSDGTAARLLAQVTGVAERWPRGEPWQWALRTGAALEPAPAGGLLSDEIRKVLSVQIPRGQSSISQPLATAEPLASRYAAYLVAIAPDVREHPERDAVLAAALERFAATVGRCGGTVESLQPRELCARWESSPERVGSAPSIADLHASKDGVPSAVANAATCAALLLPRVPGAPTEGMHLGLAAGSALCGSVPLPLGTASVDVGPVQRAVSYIGTRVGTEADLGAPQGTSTAVPRTPGSAPGEGEGSFAGNSGPPTSPAVQASASDAASGAAAAGGTLQRVVISDARDWALAHARAAVHLEMFGIAGSAFGKTSPEVGAWRPLAAQTALKVRGGALKGSGITELALTPAPVGYTRALAAVRRRNWVAARAFLHEVLDTVQKCETATNSTASSSGQPGWMLDATRRWASALYRVVCKNATSGTDDPICVQLGEVGAEIVEEPDDSDQSSPASRSARDDSRARRPRPATRSERQRKLINTARSAASPSAERPTSTSGIGVVVKALRAGGLQRSGSGDSCTTQGTELEQQSEPARTPQDCAVNLSFGVDAGRTFSSLPVPEQDLRIRQEHSEPGSEPGGSSALASPSPAAQTQLTAPGQDASCGSRTGLLGASVNSGTARRRSSEIPALPVEFMLAADVRALLGASPPPLVVTQSGGRSAVDDNGQLVKNVSTKLINVLRLFVILYNTIVMPVGTVFDSLGGEKGGTYGIGLALWLLSYVGDIILFVDIWSNFSEPVITQEGRVVTARAELAKLYMRSDLALDLTAALPWEFVIATFDLELMLGNWTFRLNRVLGILRVPTLFDQVVDDFFPGAHPLKLRIGMFLVLLLVALCWLGCIWATVLFSYEGWDSIDDLLQNERGTFQSLNMPMRTLWAFHWALRSFSGYEPNWPNHPLDRYLGLCLAVALCGLGMFATVIAYVQGVVDVLGGNARVHRERVEEVREVLNYAGIPEEARAEVVLYLRKLFRQTAQVSVGQFDFLDQELPPVFAACIHVYSNWALAVGPTASPMLRSQRGDFTVRVLELLQHEFWAPEEVVIRRGDMPCSSIYFVFRGEAMAVVADGADGAESDVVLEYLDPGGWWGEISNEHPQPASLKCTVWTELLRLDTAAWEELAEDWPECAMAFQVKQRARRARARAARQDAMRELLLSCASSPSSPGRLELSDHSSSSSNETT